MKIVYNDDGFEKLDEFNYVYSRDVFRRNNLYYRYVRKCAECGDSFFMRISYPTTFCSKKCANTSKITKEKISLSLTGHKRSKLECVNISNRLSKGGVVFSNIPLFDTYAHQLFPIEAVRNNNGILEVRCAFCSKWFIPKRTSVESRAQYIKGNISIESRLYCSDICKYNCPIFNKHKYPRGFNPRGNRNTLKFTESELRVWSDEVLKRADYKCEYCGEIAVHAHHIESKKLKPFFALDPDNGVACCIKCHYTYGHSGNCSAVVIANTIC
jgi:5-methylcytosine-specific restriction endonuclease McrA